MIMFRHAVAAQATQLHGGSKASAIVSSMFLVCTPLVADTMIHQPYLMFLSYVFASRCVIATFPQESAFLSGI